MKNAKIGRYPLLTEKLKKTYIIICGAREFEQTLGTQDGDSEPMKMNRLAKNEP